MTVFLWHLLMGCVFAGVFLCLTLYLARSNARFHMLAENIGDVVCLHGFDGKCLYVSPSVTRVLGHPRHTCPAQHVHSEDKPHLDWMFRRSVETNEPLRCTFRVRTVSGNLIWLESLLRPLPGGVVVASRDVTDRKRVEDLYRILADSLPKNTFVLYDCEFRVMLAAGPVVRRNEHLSGKLEGRLLKEVFQPLLDREQVVVEGRSWSEVLAGRGSITEFPLYGALHQIQHVPVLEGAEVIAGLMVVTNVMEERAREAVLQDRTEELERSNRDLEQFADIASHELKTPLRHISSFAEILAHEHTGLLSDEADMCISNITQGVYEMQGVLEALLRYSRAKTTESRMQTVDLAQLGKQVVRALKTRIEENGGQVEMGDLPTVRGDPVLLKQLLENLIWNGIKFSKPSPVVRVSAARDLLDWVLSVEDNGPGVDHEHRQFIFQMFKRSRVDVEGSGIGLALCKKIVGIHRGKIWVEDGSGTFGRRGAVFRFSIPARVRDETTPP